MKGIFEMEPHKLLSFFQCSTEIDEDGSISVKLGFQKLKYTLNTVLINIEKFRSLFQNTRKFLQTTSQSVH